MKINISKDFMIIVSTMLFGLIVWVFIWTSAVNAAKNKRMEEQRCHSLAEFSSKYHYAFHNEDGGFLSQNQTAKLLTIDVKIYAKRLGISNQALDKIELDLESVPKEENDGLYDMINDQCHAKYDNWF